MMMGNETKINHKKRCKMQNIELAFKFTESLEKTRQILEDIEAFECKIQKNSMISS